MIYIVPACIVFTLLSIRDGLEIKYGRNKAWHFTGALIRCTLLVPLYEYYRLFPLVISVGWALYDIGVNIASKKPILFVGTTAFIDKAMQWVAFKTGINDRVASLMIKLFLINTSILILI